jgi:hypothetical protein
MGTESKAGLLTIRAGQEQKGLSYVVLSFLSVGMFQGGMPPCLGCCCSNRSQDLISLRVWEFAASCLLTDLTL